MTISYQIGEEDFLNYQLYAASISRRIRVKRRRSRMIVSVFYFLFGLGCYFMNKPLLMIVFFLISVLWFLLYPLWEQRRYVNHYRSFIAENYKERLSKTSSVTFQDDFILMKEDGSESKISTKEMDSIVELREAIYVKLKSGVSLILPKNNIREIEQLIPHLKELATTLKIDYSMDYSWKWK